MIAADMFSDRSYANLPSQSNLSDGDVVQIASCVYLGI